MVQWQFGDPSAKTDSGTKQVFPQLKIEHSLSRLGDPNELNLRGTSRLSIRSHSRVNSKHLTRSIDSLHLPVIPDGIEVKVAEDRSKPHIPIFGRTSELSYRIESRLTNHSNGESSIRSNSDQHSNNQSSIQELDLLLRQKLKTGYFSLKNLFLSYDPESGKVDRQTLHRILSTFLIAKISLSQFHRLMKRFGLSNAKNITFEEFYSLFKKRKNNDSSANEVPLWFESTVKKETFSTSQQAHQYLTSISKDKHTFIEQLDLNEDGKLFKPILHEKLKELNYNLKPLEFEKLWSKYIKNDTMSIEIEELLDILNGKTARVNSSQNELHEDTESTREQSINIEKWLTKRFRQGVKDMYFAFNEFDKNGKISRDHFLLVLKDYGLALNEDHLDVFLQRCGISDNDVIPYKDFLQMFQDRSENGVTTKVLQNPNHRFNQPQFDERSVKTGISAIEAKLIDMFQHDYFVLLNKLQKIDKSKSGLISDIEFRAVLESFFKTSFSDSEYRMLLKNIARITGKVNYIDFMSKFDTKSSESLFDTATSFNEDDDVTLRSVSQCTRTTFREERSGEEIKQLIRSAVKQKYQEMEKTFRVLDEKNTDRMTINTMRRLLKKIDVYISIDEAKNIWENLITDQRGTLHFNQFVRHFGYSTKSAAFPNSKINPPVRGDRDFRIVSKNFNSCTDLIKDYARTLLEKNYSSLLYTFENIDKSKSGYIDTRTFKVTLEQICQDLSQSEITLIIDKLDDHGRIGWITFMNHLKPHRLISRTGYNMSDILKHTQ